MIFGRNHEPPSPGIIPILKKLSENLASSPAIRMSHIVHRSFPAPIACPLIAATTGTSIEFIVKGIFCIPNLYQSSSWLCDILSFVVISFIS